MSAHTMNLPGSVLLSIPRGNASEMRFSIMNELGQDFLIVSTYDTIADEYTDFLWVPVDSKASKLVDALGRIGVTQ